MKTSKKNGNGINNMKNTSSILIQPEWTQNIPKSCNVWQGTTVENIYSHGSKKRGTYYEKNIAKPILEGIGFKVTNAETITSPYDLKIEKPENTTNISIQGTNKENKYKKIEVKVSMSGTNHKKGCVDNFKCIINHVAKSKDFDILLMIFIVLENGKAHARVRWCSKLDIVNHINSPDSLFQKQQGGKKGNNDDWICSGKTRIKKLLENPLFKNLDSLKSVL